MFADMTKTTRNIILGIFAILFIANIVFFFRAKRKQEAPVEDAGKTVHADIRSEELTFHDETLSLKKHLETILFIGTDSSSSVPDESNLDELNFYNTIQADVLVLLVIDNDEKTITPIQINRDTMTDVPWLDVVGQQGGTLYQQICLAYNSGSGGTDSCELTRDVVSNLLFDLPIDNYFAFTMSGISILNDLVGGVTVTLVDDLTPVDSSLIQGTTVTLKGKQAEHFIRARTELTDDTNISRMRRHRDYFQGFIESARDTYESDDAFAIRVIEALQQFLITDMTADKLSETVEKLDEYEIMAVKYAEGDLQIGEFYEFYVDEDDLWEIVSESCCIK